ncbi:MAG: Zn-dependent hydrolase [Alcanivorax sp.]|nr:Zn-dependent hydrolase [Alcanivorax sp.]
MIGRIRAWHDQRRIERRGLQALWQAQAPQMAWLQRYSDAERERIGALALRFMVRKHILGGAGFAVTEAMRLRVAALAVVPVLGLGLHWYRDWNAVVLYEAAFIPAHSWQDDAGVVHESDEPLTGEAWMQGPVILSWEDVLASDDPGHAGYNVVIHEMAHKLDMLGPGGANGAPPLHRGMDPQRWHDVMQTAWDDLARAEAAGAPLPLDPYGLEDAGEFFAVLSECFFDAPGHLAAQWPDVYEQLALFYRQDPLGQA